MTNEELKQEIVQRTGIPADLLTGETAEENIVRAKALIKFAKDRTPEQPKSTRESFAAWFNEVQGTEQEDNRMQAITDLENSMRSYPVLTDGGEAQGMNARPAKESFAEWFYQKTAFDPRKNNGWTPLG